MSNETEEIEGTADVDEMHRLMELEAQEKAAKANPEPQPEPVAQPNPEPQVAAVETPSAPPVAPPAPAQQPNADDPMEWAKKKGLSSPEAMARSLQSMEEEFHRRNQQGHPGYRDIQNGNPAPQAAPPPPNWQPAPQAPGYGYPPPNGNGYAPPRPTRKQITDQIAQESGMDPDDVDRLVPLIVKVSEAISSQKTMQLERDLSEVRRQSARSSEFVQLSQDPAFADPRVQKEMHEVLKDGSLFQRGGSPYVAAFQIALTNLARKQLQQGTIQETTNQPPVTAGGGNGSVNTAPRQITEAVFASWSDVEQDAYVKSNGRIVPKR